MIVSVAKMRRLEEASFARGVSAEVLMEQAGREAAAALLELHPRRGVCLAVFGKGNNGGDALVTARHLAHAGWETHLVPAFPPAAWDDLPRRKFAEAGLARQHSPGLEGLQAAVAAASPGLPLLLLDGLLGVGSRGALREPVAGLVSALNELRHTHEAAVAALDLPTGLEADSGQPGEPCVTADWTLTIGAPKRGLVSDAATARAGRLVLLALPELAPPESSGAGETLATAGRLARLLPPRSFDTHKGQCGRIAIVAGSRGLTGAARLCSEACARAGAGLITLYVPEDGYSTLATAAAPEVMVQPVASYREVLEKSHEVLAIGPGLGHTREEEVRELLRSSRVPTVIDADALNLLAHDLSLLKDPPAPRLLTPHPGEMARLDPSSKEKPRREAARDFAAAHPVTLLLKGARTVVAERNRPLSYNTTGHPGMATGGMGDSLTGVCAALAGQGLSFYDAARLGAWLCGRAAELALARGGQSAESLIPTDVTANLGRAFAALHARGY